MPIIEPYPTELPTELNCPKCNCTFDPSDLVGVPLGMFHCEQCGEMVLAGSKHPSPCTDHFDYSELENVESKN